MLSLLLALTASAVPLQLDHQGRLFDTAGLPIVGSHDVTIALYDADTNGTELHAESQTGVAFDEGYFLVRLGTDGGNLLEASDLDVAELWVELTVGTDTFARVKATSVPFAVLADTATNVSGGTVDASAITIGGSPLSSTNLSDTSDLVRAADITDVVRDTDITDVVRDSDITDVVRDSDITDVVRDADITDVVRDSDITDVVRDADITDVVRDADITDVVRDSDITDVVRDSDITDVVRDGDLATVATTGQYSDLIGAPSGGGGLAVANFRGQLDNESDLVPNGGFVHLADKMSYDNTVFEIVDTGTFGIRFLKAGTVQYSFHQQVRMNVDGVGHVFVSGICTGNPEHRIRTPNSTDWVDANTEGVCTVSANDTLIFWLNKTSGLFVDMDSGFTSNVDILWMGDP